MINSNCTCFFQDIFHVCFTIKKKILPHLGYKSLHFFCFFLPTFFTLNQWEYDDTAEHVSSFWLARKTLGFGFFFFFACLLVDSLFLKCLEFSSGFLFGRGFLIICTNACPFFSLFFFFSQGDWRCLLLACLGV